MLQFSMTSVMITTPGYIILAKESPSEAVELTFDDFRQSELTDNVNSQCELKEQSELTDKQFSDRHTD